MSSTESDHDTTGEEESDTNIYYSSKSDPSSEEGSLVDTDEEQRNTGAGEGTHNPRHDADSVDTNAGGENIEAPVQNLGEASETKNGESNTGHIIGEAEGKLGLRSTDEGSSKWDDHRRKEGKEPAEDEGQDKPLPSPSEMQGKLTKSSHP